MNPNDLFNQIIENVKQSNRNNDELIQDEQNTNTNTNQMPNFSPEQLEMLAKLYTSNQENENENKNFKKFLPEPGFCLKTKNLNNEKVFINICQSNEINAPKDITEQELLKIIDQDDIENSAFQFRVPMSLGDMHTELDNSGLPCIAYDCCINSDFLVKCHKYSTFMGFLVSILFDGLENKYSVKLDRNCKLLKNKKFMGQIKEHIIRTKSKPLIAEMNSNEKTLTNNSNRFETEEETNSNFQNINQKIKTQIPKYKIIREPSDGDVVEFLVAEIELPNIISADSIQLDIGEDRILLNTRSSLYHLDIYLPFNFNQDECGAQFDKKNKLLTITMPVIQ